MVYFIGAGPGAPDLITLRGAELLRSADTVIYAGSLVNPALLGMAKAECRIFNSAEMTLEQVIEAVRETESRGGMTVRLHTGDPCLYGAVREQMDALDALGIPWEDVPGVSSFCGAAAALGAEYTLPGVSQSVIITRMAGRTPAPERESLERLARHGASMVIFLSAGMLERVQEALLKGAYTEKSPASIVYKATWPEEKVVRCTVGTLAQSGAAAGIQKTALILVGDFLSPDYARSKLYDPSFTTEFRTGTGQKERMYISFSDKGEALAHRLADALGGKACRCSRPLSLEQWTQRAFAEARGLVFVGSCGIAVRAIKPWIRSKATDPAVVVVDECGQFAVPILSGHLGGANDLARQIGKVCGAVPVLTTATDANGVFAVDEWAKRQNCSILNLEKIKAVSSAVLAGKTIQVSSAWPIAGDCPSGVRRTEREDYDVRLDLRSGKSGALTLVPRILVLGVGCRKGIAQEALEEAFQELLEESGVSERAVCAAASIDLKRNETGLLAFCEAHGWPCRFYSAAQLEKAQGEFTASPFVREVTGVDNVCERSAVLASGGELYRKKAAGNGVTMALAQIPYQPTWRWREHAE